MWRPARSTLFPYTTLFRSIINGEHHGSPTNLPWGVEYVNQNTLGEPGKVVHRSEEHTSELQSHSELVCRLLLEKKNTSDSPTRDRRSSGQGASTPAGVVRR